MLDPTKDSLSISEATSKLRFILLPDYLTTESFLVLKLTRTECSKTGRHHVPQPLATTHSLFQHQKSCTFRRTLACHFTEIHVRRRARDGSPMGEETPDMKALPPRVEHAPGNAPESAPGNAPRRVAQRVSDKSEKAAKSTQIRKPPNRLQDLVVFEKGAETRRAGSKRPWNEPHGT